MCDGVDLQAAGPQAGQVSVVREGLRLGNFMNSGSWRSMSDAKDGLTSNSVCGKAAGVTLGTEIMAIIYAMKAPPAAW